MAKPRKQYGRYKLLAVNADAKTSKGNGDDTGFLTGIMYLAPSTMSGRNVCQHATPGCIAACLNTAGRGVMSSVQKGRLRKTRLFFEERAEFNRQLAEDITRLERIARANGLQAVVRLNGTSDLPWHRMMFVAPKQGIVARSVMAAFPNVRFYDYTKDARRMSEPLPDNYDLTFSRSESNHDTAVTLLHMRKRVAVVFRGAVPATYQGFPVVVGDENDLRFLDAGGVWVGLTAKGRAKRDVSGFVVDSGGTE